MTEQATVNVITDSNDNDEVVVSFPNSETLLKATKLDYDKNVVWDEPQTAEVVFGFIGIDESVRVETEAKAALVKIVNAREAQERADKELKARVDYDLAIAKTYQPAGVAIKEKLPQATIILPAFNSARFSNLDMTLHIEVDGFKWTAERTAAYSSDRYRSRVSYLYWEVTRKGEYKATAKPRTEKTLAKKIVELVEQAQRVADYKQQETDAADTLLNTLRMCVHLGIEAVSEQKYYPSGTGRPSRPYKDNYFILRGVKFDAHLDADDDIVGSIRGCFAITAPDVKGVDAMQITAYAKIEGELNSEQLGEALKHYIK